MFPIQDLNEWVMGAHAVIYQLYRMGEQHKAVTQAEIETGLD